MSASRVGALNVSEPDVLNLIIMKSACSISGSRILKKLEMTTSPYFYKGSGIPQVKHPKNSGLKYEV